MRAVYTQRVKQVEGTASFALRMRRKLNSSTWSVVKANESTKPMDDTARAGNLKRCVDKLMADDTDPDFEIGEQEIRAGGGTRELIMVPDFSKVCGRTRLDGHTRGRPRRFRRPGANRSRVLEDLSRLQGRKIPQGE